MNRSNLITLRGAAFALVVASASLVGAQDRKPMFMGRAGITFPIDEDVRGQISNTGLTFGLSYLPKNKALFGEMALPSIDLDYYRVQGNGNRLDAIDIKYAERLFLGAPGAQSGPHVGVGIGLGFNRIDSTRTVTQTGQSGGPISVLVDFSDRRTQVAAELTFGYQWRNRGLIEGFVRVGPSIGGIGQSVIGVRAGFAF